MLTEANYSMGEAIVHPHRRWPNEEVQVAGLHTGMLTALHAWDSTHTDSSSSSSSSGGQQLSVLQELAASEMCPMRALDYAASLDWSSARPSLGAVDPARVAQFRAFVEEVKVRNGCLHHRSLT